MELEIGMYVRTINGKIWIIISQKAISGHRKDIKKASYNIIDLIEVGDIVELEESDDIACMFFRDIYRIKNEDNLFHIVDNIKNNKCKLLSIITKEQFSQMEYRIGE